MINMNIKKQIIAMNRCCSIANKYNIEYKASLAGMFVAGRYFPIAIVEQAEQWILAIADSPSAPQSNLDMF